MSWVDRIAGRETVHPSTIEPHPENWREHPDEQLETLARILGDLGQIAPLIVSKHTRRVLNGHARLRLAIDQGLDAVEVVWVDVAEDDELAVLASFDAVAQMRDVRQERLIGLMSSERVRRLAGDLHAEAAGEYERRRELLRRSGESESETAPAPRRRGQAKRRNKAWYVYAPADVAERVYELLSEELGDLEGVEVGGE